MQVLRSERKAPGKPQIIHHGKHTFYFGTSRLQFWGHKNCTEAYKSLPEFGPNDKSEDWWRAQCAFRNLKADGTLDSLQEQIRQNRNAYMLPELMRIEAVLRSKYHWKSRPKVSLVGDKTIEQLALDEPTDFLYHYFNIPSRNALILRVVAAQIRYAAIALKLVCGVMDAPVRRRTNNQSGGNHNQWLVIGRSQHHVDQAIRQVRSRVLLGQSLAAGYGSVKNILPATRDIYDRKMRQESSIEAMPREVPNSRDASPARTPSRSPDITPRASRSSSTSMAPLTLDLDLRSLSLSPYESTFMAQQPGGVHDPIAVEGIWAIHSPELKAQDPNGGDGLLCIKIDTTYTAFGGDAVQMWANFSLHTITGVMRFYQQRAAVPVDKANTRQVHVGRKQEDGSFSKPTHLAPRFLMHRSELPSRTRRDWAFAWRGGVTRRNKADAVSAAHLGCKVIFGGSTGHELKGSLISQSHGTFGFSGTRLSPQTTGVKYVMWDGWAHPAPQRLERYDNGSFIIPSHSLDTEWNDRSQRRHRRKEDMGPPSA